MTLSNEVAKFITDSGLAHQIVHGDENTQVMTEGGPVKSFAKAVKDIGSTVPFSASGAGSIARTMEEKVREGFVTPQDFMSDALRAHVASGAATISVVEAFETALSKGVPVWVPSGGRKYLFNRQLLIPSGATIYGDMSDIVLADGVNGHVLRIADNATNVKITGLRINGRKATNAGGHGIACNGGSNIRINDNYVFDCAAAGIYFAGTTMDNVDAKHNFVTGCGAGGITANSIVTHFAFNDNKAWLNGSHGVGIVGVAKHGTINSNVCWDNGQGTPNADNITGYNVENAHITVDGNACSGGLNNSIHMGGQFITITDNTVFDPTQYGIVMLANTGICNGCVVANNTVIGAGVSGYWLENCTTGSVNGNVSCDNAAHGFAIDGCFNIPFGSNSASGNGGDGFRNGVASAFLSFAGCTARANIGDGLELGNVTDSTIAGCTFTGNTGWGINASGTEARNVIGINTVRGNTAGQIAQPNVSTRVADNETGVSRSIPSAATLTIPPGGSYYYVGGTTNITNMTPSFVERQVTLQFDDVLTMTDGGNLSLASNFVTAFKRTITVIWDGAKWNEIARSSN
jgi:parallel beta-helix repeat protein